MKKTTWNTFQIYQPKISLKSNHSRVPLWNITHKFLLLPNIETIKIRDKNRNEDVVMGSEAVEEHFNEFSSKDRFSDFLIIDSSNEAAEETAQKIKDLIDKQL